MPGALHATQVELRQIGVALGVSTAEQSVLRRQRTQVPLTGSQNGVAGLRALHPVGGKALHDTQSPVIVSQ